MLKQREDVAISASLATVFIERIFDGLVMLLFVFLALPFAPLPTFYRNSVVVLTLTLIAMGQVKTANGDISSIAISTALTGAFLFDTGEIWCFFVEEQPDTDYIVLAYDANTVRAFVEDEDKATGYFVIRCVNFSGTPTNPPSLNFEVKRVI